jgi:SNF2 family DNA or RNA helicase
MPINASSVSPSSKLNHWIQAMATWPDALARSRFHADRAEYKEAAALLRDFLKTASDRLEPVLELSRVIKTQGYWRDALTVLIDELDNLPGPVGTATTREERLGIQMRIEVCRLKLFVTASFDAPLQEAEELRLQTSDFAALEELEPTTVSPVPSVYPIDLEEY